MDVPRPGRRITSRWAHDPAAGTGFAGPAPLLKPPRACQGRSLVNRVVSRMGWPFAGATGHPIGLIIRWAHHGGALGRFARWETMSDDRRVHLRVHGDRPGRSGNRTRAPRTRSRRASGSCVMTRRAWIAGRGRTIRSGEPSGDLGAAHLPASGGRSSPPPRGRRPGRALPPGGSRPGSAGSLARSTRPRRRGDHPPG